MAVTNYFTVNGEIIGEETGGTQIDYLTDALGSVTATVDQNAAIVNTYRYKPYGAQLAKTGAGADPSFRWVGTQGYRQTGKQFSDVYVRARHYSTSQGRWSTKDPIFLKSWRGRYDYSRSSPVFRVDPTGLTCHPAPPDCCDDRVAGLSDVPCNGEWTWIPFFTDNDDGPFGGCAKEGKCEKIKESIDGVLRMCDYMCGRVFGGEFGSYPDTGQPPFQGLWATAICCTEADGTKKVCGVYWCVPPGRPLRDYDPCVIKCLAKHEKRHFLHPYPDWQCPGGIVPPRNNPNPPALWECDSYYLQLMCLVREAEKKNCAFLEDYKDKIKACKDKAGGVGVPFPPYGNV